MPNKSGHPLQYTVESKAASFSVLPQDSGKLFLLTAVDLVASLPAVLPEMDGVNYKFWVVAPSAGTGASVSPAAADQIRGKGLTPADNKHSINSGASDALGDYLEVFCDGSLGWVITDSAGTWAREA